MVEITDWKPTPETRWYTPNRELVEPKLQRLFDCKASDGTTGQIWAEVHPDSPFARLVEPPSKTQKNNRVAYPCP